MSWAPFFGGLRRVGGRLVTISAAAVAVRGKRLDLRSQCGVSQARADALGDVEGGGPARHVFDAAVGQFHMNIFSHDFETYRQL